MSKGFGAVAIIRPFGETVRKTYDVKHNPKELFGLANPITAPEGESKVVLENTGR